MCAHTRELAASTSSHPAGSAGIGADLHNARLGELIHRLRWVALARVRVDLRGDAAEQAVRARACPPLIAIIRTLIAIIGTLIAIIRTLSPT